MRPLKLALPLLLISGCAHLPPLSLEGRAERAIEQGHYRHAASLIGRADSEHPSYHFLQELNRQLTQESAELSQQSREQVLSLAHTQQWKDALEILDQTQPRVVDSQPLQALREEILRQQQSHFIQLRSESRLGLAQALKGQAELLDANAQFRLAEANQEQRQLQRLRQQLVTDLDQLGQYHVQREDWQQAEQLLSLAEQLDPQRPPSPYLAKAREHLHERQRQVHAQQQHAQQRRQQQQQQQRQQQRRRAAELMQQYQLSGRLSDLLAARDFLDQHRDESLLQAKREQLNQWVESRFQSDMESAQLLYASGQYQQAHALWKSLKPLNPNDDTLTTMLERSERVLRTMEGLQSSR